MKNSVRYAEIKLLDRAIRYIEGGWTRYALARTTDSRACDFDDTRAARFCVHGAIDRVSYDLELSNQLRYAVIRRINNHLGVANPKRLLNSLTSFNDNAPSKRPVLGILRQVRQSLL